MTVTVRIALDARGHRLEVENLEDATALREYGPYDLIFDGCTLIYIPDEKGMLEHCKTTEDKAYGIGRGLRSNDKEDIRPGRFGPFNVEADIYNPEGFSVDLPPLHERPWPEIRENEGCYDVGEQMILTLAERINDCIDFCGMPVKDAIRMEGRKIPSNLRRFLPVGDAEAIIRCQMAKLRLPSASH